MISRLLLCCGVKTYGFSTKQFTVILILRSEMWKSLCESSWPRLHIAGSFIPVAQVSIEGSVKDNAVQNSPTEPLVVNDEAIFDAAFGPARAFDAPYQVSCLLMSHDVLKQRENILCHLLGCSIAFWQ